MADAAVFKHGVIAKNHPSTYRPGERGSVKAKNPTYWRRESEIEEIRRSRERHAYAR